MSCATTSTATARTTDTCMIITELMLRTRTFPAMTNTLGTTTNPVTSTLILLMAVSTYAHTLRGLKCADEPEEQAIFAHRKEVTPSCDNTSSILSPVRRPSSRFMDAVARRSTERHKGELHAARTASVECRRAAAAAASLSGDVEMPLVPMGNLIDLSDPAPLDKGKQKDRRRSCL
ncbi:hypothetical protein B0H14DRAFT_2594945 [Mycena olivaceomarginata]|nr:hypothetical protein B0H14DRAFT_2594945 [Mycena olivaceomarginata]